MSLVYNIISFKDMIMVELQNPKSIIKDLAKNIEKERKRQKLQQKELAEKSSVPLATYKNFIYNDKISLEAVLKILFALKMTDNINGLVKEREFKTIEEIENKDMIPQRIRK